MLLPSDTGMGSEVRLLGIALYSERYPAIGETHGLSVVVGALVDRIGASATCHVIDLVARGAEDIEGVLAAVGEQQPNVLALSVPYGTYDLLRAFRRPILELLDQGALVMVGGPLPTYLKSKIHDDIDPRVVVVVGEGEVAAVELVSRWSAGLALDGIANTVVQVHGETVEGPRRLTDVRAVPYPYREHLPEILATGAQVFLESSRACSWAACSFCLRGLTDVRGHASEYRRLPVERLLHDLDKLRALGVTAATFADEDFMGGPLEASEAFVAEWAERTPAHAKPIKFDVSATIRSVWDDADDDNARARRQALLAAYRDLGLNKVFLGIESGSPSQLRRYHKGHTPQESAAACQEVLDSGARLEIGFIMFDPLVTLSEVVENVNFLLDNDLSQYVSGPTSELRLQTTSRYIALLSRAETRMKRRLRAEHFDPNTLTYECEYADLSVAELVLAVRAHNDESHPLVYSVKGLTRFGSGTLMGEQIDSARDALGDYRRQTLVSLRDAADGDVASYRPRASDAWRHLARALLEIAPQVPDPEHPMIIRAVNAAYAAFGPPG